MSFPSAGNGFAQFAKEIPRAPSVFQRVAPTNPTAGFGSNNMANQGNIALAPAPTPGATQHRILYPDNAVEFGNLRLQSPPRDVTPADLGNGPRQETNRMNRNTAPLSTDSSSAFGGSKGFSNAHANDGFGSQQQNTFATTSNVLPGFGSEAQPQQSFASYPSQQSFGSQQSSFGVSKEEPEERRYNAEPRGMPLKSPNTKMAGFGERDHLHNTLVSTHPANGDRRVSPSSQNFGQPSAGHHVSFAADSRTVQSSPAANNQSPTSLSPVTADQVDSIARNIEAINFATNGFLDILAGAGEKLVLLRDAHRARFN